MHVTDPLPAVVERVIEAATWAPSNHNTQPWKFVAEENVIHIFPDFTRAMPVADPQYRELIISLGCALENLIVAARHEGYSVRTKIFPPNIDGIVAELRPVTFPADRQEEALYEAIADRQTTRRPFDGSILEPEVIRAIENVPLEHGVNLRLLTAPAELDQVAALVRRADEQWFTRADYKREHTGWLRFSRRTAEERRDGLTAAARGRQLLPDWFGRLAARFITRPADQAAEDEQLIRSASGALLFYTVQNDAASWVSLGQSFERVALTLTHLGLKHAHHNQPCEISALHSEFRRVFGPTVAFPQLLVRIGYAENMPASPRRHLEEVMA